MKPEQILPDFKNALERYREAMALDPVDDVHRAGCIQYFEFTFDLAWKSVQAVAAFYGVEPVKSPRAAFKTAYSQGWIDEQAPWLSMLEARNRMAHVYNAEEALMIYENLPQFIRPFEQLHQKLLSLIQDD
ncbi:nucleotidyltransferase [Coraliomargarita sinensis]|uniref:Nucleotidyltransferase n=1 Tax=Coraliomargarita sinensis TaxID=2174842 RepID=A0A317ZFM2_9BACT|nr:HI0074 family nucleotidyltransferase substrate-binding subunit [Coraliomargarita sinensis]PXA03662.1 nucleotidyltransferase [Coraliomargarita sinensis]